MENINQIKLNIWGIRGGFRSFCHSEDLNVEEPEIKNTWKDIRDFVYVSSLSVRFFALEFTPTYKVFTIYRSVNDTSRTGAYVATTLYVPHGLKVNRVLELLRQISDAYYRDHYDAFGNPNSNSDYTQIYTEIINNYAANLEIESKRRSWPASAQDNTPKILPYNDINVVEKFFAEPYRREFLVCQEVMFWDGNILVHTQDYGVQFQKADSIKKENCFDLNGEGIKEQFKGGQIRNNPPLDCELVGFRLNGMDVTKSWASTYFDDDDEVEIVLSKPFHEEKTYRGAIKGTGSPFVKKGIDYEFTQVYFNPRLFSARIVVPADLAQNEFDLYVNNTPVSIERGTGVMSFWGNEMDSIAKISLRYFNAIFPVMELKLRDLFPNGNDSAQTLFVNVVNLKKVKFEFDRSTTGKVSINGQKLGFVSDINACCEFVLPADLRTDANSFIFNVGEMGAKVEAKNSTTFKVTLTPNYFYAGITLDQGMENFVDYNCFKLKTRGGLYLSSPGFRFKLPQNEKLFVKNKDAQLGLLVSNGQTTLPCEYEIKSGNGECEILMKPNLALYYNESNATVTLSSDKGVSVSIPANKRSVLPVMKWILKDGKGDKSTCEIKEEPYYGCRQFTIRQKVVVSGTNSTYTFGSSSYGNSSQGEGKQNRIKNDYLCFYYNNTVQPISGAPIVYGNYDYKCYTIKNVEPDRNLMLCYHIDNSPFMEKTNEFCATNNNKNGFEVGLDGHGFYVVKDVESKGQKKGGTSNKGHDGNGQGKKKWIILGCLASAILLVIGLLMWKPWAVEKADYYVKIEMAHGTMIDNVVPDPRTKFVGEPLKSGTTAMISLRSGWNEVSLRVVTKEEGECNVKLIEEGKDKKPRVEPDNIDTTWSTNTLTITLESPAWKELETLLNGSIGEYAAFADTCKSSSIRKECGERAYKIVEDSDFSDTLKLMEYIKYFKDDEDKVRVCEDSLRSIREQVKQEKAEHVAAAQRQNDLADFKTKLGIVYSKNCTLSAIDALGSAYNRVKTYDWKEEAGKVIRNDKGTRIRPSEDDFLDNLISNQREFFDAVYKVLSVEDPDKVDFAKAKTIIERYKSSFKSYFSIEQKEAMDILLENDCCLFKNWYIRYFKSKGSNAIYKYILENKSTARDETDCSGDDRRPSTKISIL